MIPYFLIIQNIRGLQTICLRTEFKSIRKWSSREKVARKTNLDAILFEFVRQGLRHIQKEKG